MDIRRKNARRFAADARVTVAAASEPRSTVGMRVHDVKKAWA